jgi:cysteine desulfurase
MKYFDYTATTPVDDEVLETYIKTTKNFFANSSSLHKLGQRSNMMYTKAIEQFQEVLGVKNHNIVFTSNATEANNLALFGVCSKYEQGKVISTKIEHASVFEPLKALESKFDVVYLDINEKGLINFLAIIIYFILLAVSVYSVGDKPSLFIKISKKD